jgi:uncharacterized protein YdiU (UPF0061 family)
VVVTERQDFQPVDDLMAVVAHPYDDQSGLEKYAKPALPEEIVSQIFRGTRC